MQRFEQPPHWPSLADRPSARRCRRPGGAFAPLALAALLASLLAGCSSWSTGALEQSLLKAPRMSHDTVVLELAVVDISDPERLWREVDEQHLPVETRRKLAEHGIRAGVLGTEVPGWIKDRLAERQNTVQVDEDGSAKVGDEQRQRHLQCRGGQPRIIELGPSHAELTRDDLCNDSSPVLKNAQCQLSVVSQPQGDGRVRVQVTPEICHGVPRHRWLGNDGSFRVDVARSCERYDDLTLTATLTPGQTLVLSAASAANGLGGYLFLPQDAPGRREVLLLRLAQTQFDDLFSPPPVFTPIATDAL